MELVTLYGALCTYINTLPADNVGVDVSDVTLPEPLPEAQSSEGTRPGTDHTKEAKEPKAPPRPPPPKAKNVELVRHR